MKNKFLIVLASIFIFSTIIGVVSCDKCGPFPDKFKLIDMNIRILQVQNLDSNFIEFVEASEGDTIAWSDFAINIQFVTEDFFSQIESKNSFDLMNTAYACSPVLPTTDEKIDSIIIKSSSDFDVNHPAGTNLAALFDVVVRDGSVQDKIGLPEFTNMTPSIPRESVILKLNTTIDIEKEMELEISYFQQGVDIDFLLIKTEAFVIRP